jgi:hypothetical protein
MLICCFPPSRASFKTELPITTFARICVSAIVICHYPLQANPARRSALTLWKSMTGGQEPSPVLHGVRYASITVSYRNAQIRIYIANNDAKLYHYVFCFSDGIFGGLAADCSLCERPRGGSIYRGRNRLYRCVLYLTGGVLLQHVRGKTDQKY